MSRVDIIIDCSGSMNEWGKKDLLIYLLNTIKNQCNKDIFRENTIKYLQWNSTLSTIANPNDILVFGNSDISKLYGYINASATEGSSIILLSDGNFDTHKKPKFNFHNIYPISIGYDCNVNTLRSLSSESKVYTCNEILEILHRISFGGGASSVNN